MPDNCPWCNAPIQTDDQNDPMWTCGSIIHDPNPWQSPNCRKAVAEVEAMKLEKELRLAMQTIERLTGKLLRVRDLIKYHANSESGLVAEIDNLFKDGTDGINTDH